MVERRWREIAGLSAMEGWRLPVLFYRGESDRPGAYLQAALHADEQPGVAVIHELAGLIGRAEAEGRLKRNVTLVPYANPIGLSQVVAGRHLGRFHLATGVNFNRAFPLPNTARAEPAEALSPKADRALKEALLELAEGASVILDLHCDKEAALYMYTHADLWPSAADLAARLGAAAVLLWSGPEEGGAAFEEAVTVARLPPSAAAPFLSATVELRGRADVDAGLARRDAHALYELLADRGILSDPAIDPCPPWRGPAGRHDRVVNLPAPALGALYLEAALGSRVRAGQCIARILAEPGHADGEVKVLAPVDGLLFVRALDRLARPGDTIATIMADAPVPGSAAGKTLSN
jgi:predicted deacylase